MKIIDFKKKGNVVRFYLGDDNLNEWWGDDWNDVPYEHNAGAVYAEYVKSHKDLSFGFDSLVLEPADGVSNSYWSKEDMIHRAVPCIIVIPPEKVDDWQEDFQFYVGMDGIKRFYFGDQLD